MLGWLALRSIRLWKKLWWLDLPCWTSSSNRELLCEFKVSRLRVDVFQDLIPLPPFRSALAPFHHHIYHLWVETKISSLLRVNFAQWFFKTTRLPRGTREALEGEHLSKTTLRSLEVGHTGWKTLWQTWVRYGNIHQRSFIGYRVTGCRVKSHIG